jgi:hypothetical protein
MLLGAAFKDFGWILDYRRGMIAVRLRIWEFGLGHLLK